MAYIEFDDYGKAYVPEDIFMDYVKENAQDGDYTRENEGVISYYNIGGCLLARYDRNKGCGEIF